LLGLGRGGRRGGGRPSRTSRRRTQNRPGEAADGIFDTPAGSGWCPASIWTDRTLPPVDDQKHLWAVGCVRVSVRVEEE